MGEDLSMVRVLLLLSLVAAVSGFSPAPPSHPSLSSWRGAVSSRGLEKIDRQVGGSIRASRHVRDAPRLRVRPAQAITMGAGLAHAARTATLGYAILVGAGGILAGLKTGSKPSIISGVVSCIILAIAYTKNLNPLALGTSAALTIVFAIRFKKTGKMMPAGMLGGLSFIMSILLGLAQFQ